MAQDYVHPLQALRAVMVQKRRTLAESLLRSRKGAKAAKRRKQLAKERTSEENASGSLDMAVEPMELVKARLTELSERLTGSTTVSKPGAR